MVSVAQQHLASEKAAVMVTKLVTFSCWMSYKVITVLAGFTMASAMASAEAATWTFLMVIKLVRPYPWQYVLSTFSPHKAYLKSILESKR